MLCYITLLVIVANSSLSKQVYLHQLENSFNQWSEESISSNSFYTLPADHSYYSIDVSLEHEDQTFLLVQLVTEQDQLNFNYIKISSYLDGQLERHVVVYNEHHKQNIIQVISQNNTKHKIKVTPLMELGNNCLNQCNHHGLCHKQQCECFQGYFGNDCHSQVIKFSDSSNLNLNVPEKMQYYVMELKEQKKQVEISFLLEIYEDLKVTFFNDIKLQSETLVKGDKKVMRLVAELNFSQITKNLAIFSAEKTINKKQHILTSLSTKKDEESFKFMTKMNLGVFAGSILVLVVVIKGPVIIRCCCS
ncbi:unnamed protein product [Paramecium octaurelia]|uniref:EGF-like domain-containing protein n=1 Tax=Paramecium octaurelia TaxID=43137 RepID=A0A8S1WE34_PAROT|nr:unnamed protein product [Paramecium octaurelia]